MAGELVVRVIYAFEFLARSKIFVKVTVEGCCPSSLIETLLAKITKVAMCKTPLCTFDNRLDWKQTSPNAARNLYQLAHRLKPKL